MKKHELENCPQWLLDADTLNEDVRWHSSDNTILVWEGGYFRGGEFLGGYFLGGEFLGGEFLGFTPSKKWTVKVFKNGEIGIGCKTKTIKAWDRWFEGDEEFSSPRNSEDFKYIKSHWELCKAYLFFLRDFEPSHPVIKVVKFD